MSKKKYVYFFGDGKAEGRADMRSLLGGKGANLAEMTNIGLPVPPGFTISTEACAYFSEHGGDYPEGLREEVLNNMKRLEEVMGARFGDNTDPLLVSVRSGAAASMPGMMDTVLNLGINPDAVEGLTKKTNNARFAWDSYRRFIQMFGNVVTGISSEAFEHEIERIKKKRGVEEDTELTVDDLKELVEAYKRVYTEQNNEQFPDDPEGQLFKAINAVFNSWNNERAVRYRQMNDIRGLIGTAVNVQSMVFGNMGDNSGTGVAFTRDPSTGENKFYGEYLMNAQGEDVVAGIRTPLTIDTLKEENPEVYKELVEVRSKLENHYRDMQDMEFTIQEGKLYMLQTRTGKRTVFSWLRTQVEMVESGLIDKKTAVKRVPAGEFGKLFAPVLDNDEIKKQGKYPVAKGLNASPGGASGRVALSAKEAERLAAEGKHVILVRKETSPEDIGGMAAAKGILTSRGGMTSHAAVVARGMGCPCVSGAGDVRIDYDKKQLSAGGEVVKEGEYISIDGFTGEVYVGPLNVRHSEIVQVLNGQMKPEDSLLYQDYAKFMSYVEEMRRLRVRTNADTPEDTKMAVKFGAEGIGLCRTEHMFFEGERIISMRKMILAKNEIDRREALNELLPMQRKDFEGIFRALGRRPATIRLLDPPLHEFLPHDHTSRHDMALQLGVSTDEIAQAVADLHEFNPMMGFRGCRLAIIYPEILEMQVRAIIEAALNLSDEGIDVEPEIMIPLVGVDKELAYTKKHAEAAIQQIFSERGKTISYKIGTMIEIPRACVTADEIAPHAEFFSFGTNDLTQMACGFSRDDSGKFLNKYVEDEDKQFFDYDPFQVLDIQGVGKLVRMAVEQGRQAKPDIKLGICGEHGGDPKTIAFCEELNLDYVSCSPYRVPIARLAAAQAVLNSKES